MKSLLFIACLILAGIPVTAQVSLSVSAGATPTTDPGTPFIFVNGEDFGSLFKFNAEEVKYSPQIGLGLKWQVRPFWFMTEISYYERTTKYSVDYWYDEFTSSSDMFLNDKQSILELPVSVGVSLGIVEVTSGLSISYDVQYTTELDQISGFESSAEPIRLGWHMGVGINFHRFVAGIRYQQYFSNYGSDLYVHDDELELIGSMGRFVATVGMRLWESKPKVVK